MASIIQVKESKKGLTFAIQVTPRASRAEITGGQDGALKLKVTAQPVEGVANIACINFLAKVLKLRKSQLEILAGEKSRKKVVLVKDISKKDLEEKINNIL
ncbi:MAG: DUF167 domain-containing protein [Smithellaceae bacterium]